MDYETADGSQFSLREVFSKDDRFQCTLITAFVDGNAYAGKSSQRMDEMDDADVLQFLEPVPPENVFPLLPEGFTVAPSFDADQHYLKAPQFTYEDSQPGQKLVADTLLQETSILEILRRSPHPNLATYHGAVVKDGRITHLSLQRYDCNLTERIDNGLSQEECEQVLLEIEAGLQHLHSLGLAHNDINPYNVCVDTEGHAVLIDFDACIEFGQPLNKGASRNMQSVSAAENDFCGLDEIRDLIYLNVEPQASHVGSRVDPQPGD